MAGGSILAAPLAAEAQPPTKVPRVGFLSAVPRSSPGIRAFEERLRELGYVDGPRFPADFTAVNARVLAEAREHGLPENKMGAAPISADRR